MPINRIAAKEIIAKVQPQLRKAARQERKAFINAHHINQNPVEIAQKQMYHSMPNNKKLAAEIDRITSYSAMKNYVKTIDSSAPKVSTGSFFG